MNKILEKLYRSYAEDNAFNSVEVERKYNNFYDTYTAGMSLQGKNQFFDMFNNYTTAVEEDAFEVGFKAAVQLFMGGGQV